MKTVVKKILPEYFDEVVKGNKTFELRKDEDIIQEGDIIKLWEYKDGKFTGNAIRKKVGYVLRNCPQYGLSDGYCIISLLPADRN